MTTQTTAHDDKVVKRRIRLAGKPSDEQARRLEQELKQVDGVMSLSVEKERGRLELVYDVTGADLDDLLARSKDYGFQPRRSLPTNTRLGWYRFLDQNIRDNAGHKPHCCSEPPK